MSDDEFTFALKKKKKKKKQRPVEQDEEVKQDVPDDRDYTYLELLNRLYEKLPSELSNEKLTLRPPIISFIGKRTVWKNFNNFCHNIKRSNEHVSSFFITELTTSGSMDSACQLILNGRFKQNDIQTLVKQYVNEYVICHVCKKADTFLDKDPVTRLTFVTCNRCNSKKSVTMIKKGYKAVSRADRRQ